MLWEPALAGDIMSSVLPDPIARQAGECSCVTGTPAIHGGRTGSYDFLVRFFFFDFFFGIFLAPIVPALSSSNADCTHSM